MTDQLKIRALTGHNVFQFRCVSLQFGDGETVLVGENGEGKSNLLTLMRAAIDSGLPQELITHDATTGGFSLLLGGTEDIRIERERNEAGKWRCRVFRNNAEIKAPQSFLDTLVNGVAFRPLEWAARFETGKIADERLATSELMEALPMALTDALLDRYGVEKPDSVGLYGHGLEANQRLLAALLDEQKTNNAAIDTLEIEIRDIERPTRDANVEDAQAAYNQAVADERAAIRKDAEIDAMEDSDKRRREELARLREREARGVDYLASMVIPEESSEHIKECAARIGELEADIAALEARLTRARQMLDDERSRHTRYTKAHATHDAKVAEKVRAEDTLAEIRRQIAELEAAADTETPERPDLTAASERVTAATVKMNEERALLQQWATWNAAAKKRDKIQERTVRKERLEGWIKITRDDLPKAMLSEAGCPIDGLTVDADGRLRKDGTLIAQLSTAQKISLGLDIATMNPESRKLRVVCVDGAETLGRNIAEMVRKRLSDGGWQAFYTCNPYSYLASYRTHQVAGGAVEEAKPE